MRYSSRIEHADHTHGIDELRVFYLHDRKRVPVWADEKDRHVADEPFRILLLRRAGQRLSADPQPSIGSSREIALRSRGKAA